ncbi:unnamed protein product [Brassica rapa subsp. trilocularis]
MTYSPLQQQSGRRIIRNCLPPLASAIQEALQPSFWSTRHRCRHSLILDWHLSRCRCELLHRRYANQMLASAENENQIQHRSAARERREVTEEREW